MEINLRKPATLTFPKGGYRIKTINDILANIYNQLSVWWR